MDCCAWTWHKNALQPVVLAMQNFAEEIVSKLSADAVHETIAKAYEVLVLTGRAQSAASNNRATQRQVVGPHWRRRQTHERARILQIGHDQLVLCTRDTDGRLVDIDVGLRVRGDHFQKLAFASASTQPLYLCCL